MPALVYGLGLQKFVRGSINFGSDTIKAALLGTGYTPNQDTHEFWSNVSANEVSGTGYTAGGATLASKTDNYTAATNTVALDAADPSWANSTISARYVVIYKDTGTASTSPLICYDDLGSAIASTNATWTYQISASGLLTLTAA